MECGADWGINMLEVLILRFDAPLMSFGTTMIDNLGVIQEFPGLSLITGLLGNALGFEHRDAASLQELQSRVVYAVRADLRGEFLQDYQSVDLGTEYMRAQEVGWTTRGKVSSRGGASGTGTHLRYRDYWAGAMFTLALSLRNADRSPTMTELGTALRDPARPLFLGRKCCIPSSPVFLKQVQAETCLEALVNEPTPVRRAQTKKTSKEKVAVWFPVDEKPLPCVQEIREMVVVDIRDWHDQIHVGQRTIRHGLFLEGG